MVTESVLTWDNNGYRMKKRKKKPYFYQEIKRFRIFMEKINFSFSVVRKIF